MVPRFRLELTIYVCIGTCCSDTAEATELLGARAGAFDIVLAEVSMFEIVHTGVARYFAIQVIQQQIQLTEAVTCLYAGQGCCT